MVLFSSLLQFPNPSDADTDGLLAMGGDLSCERLLLAYNNGIFPWYEEGQPILWWSPDPRMILFPEKLKVSKSLRRTINSEKFKITFNTAFSEVIENCSVVKRGKQLGTWITDGMKEGYIELHAKGHAISVEVWNKDLLVGGLYGVDLPDRKVFCGESMFSKERDASKVGFCSLVSQLLEKEYRFIDCQVYTSHLASLGAEEIDRDDFLQLLDN